MNDLRKLLEGNEAYPPSELLWKQIVNLTEKKTRDNKLQDIQSRMKQEVNKYRPSLPEPKVSRFHYNSQYYYLDCKNRIYSIDDENPIVGNLVGEINGDQVIIDKVVVFTLPLVKVQEKIISISVDGKPIDEKKYYVDVLKKAYRGFHPNHSYVVEIGRLNPSDRIILK